MRSPRSRGSPRRPRDQDRLGDHADPGTHAGEHGDDRGDARPALRRALPARARHLWPTGRRGLARPAWGKPLEKTREYVEIVRAALRRETLEHHGEHYDIPYADRRDGARQAAEADGAAAACGDPDLPRRRSAPKAVELAFEIADGWLPIFLSPERRRDVFRDVDRERARASTSPPRVPVDPHRRRAGRARRASSRTTRCTSAAWARAGRTSTTTSFVPLRLRGGGEGDPGSLPRRHPARRCRSGAGRLRRRGRARRAEGAARRADRRVARVGRDLAPRVHARRDALRAVADVGRVSARDRVRRVCARYGTPCSKRAARVSSAPSSPRT